MVSSRNLMQVRLLWSLGLGEHGVPVGACLILQCRVPNLLTGTHCRLAMPASDAQLLQLDADAAAVGASQDLDVQCRTIRPVCRWDAEEGRGRG